MILGAGVYQLPLISAAQSRGFCAIVVSRKGDYPGIQIADKFLEIDTTDSKSILDSAREYSICGIATSGSDVCIPSVGLVVDSLGLSGSGFESSLKSMNKKAMKQAFLSFDVPTPRFGIAESINETLF